MPASCCCCPREPAAAPISACGPPRPASCNAAFRVILKRLISTSRAASRRPTSFVTWAKAWSVTRQRASSIPAAAESWEISEDGLKYTFHLRDGLRWSNGEALTASHFVAGMRRLVDPSTAAFYAEMLGDLENAAAITSGDIPVSMLGCRGPRRADRRAPARATDTVPDQPDDASEHVPHPSGLYR